MSTASAIIERCTRECSSDGYVSYPALSAALERELQIACRDLDTMRGTNATPSRGCKLIDRPLGDAIVIVEYEFEPGEPARLSGPPEDCSPGYGGSASIVNVLINGHWIDPDGMLDADLLERWADEIVAIEEECL